MTERERFLTTMRGDAVRPPLWEEGIQEDTWEAWKAQGLVSPEKFLRHFPFDRREVIEPNLAPSANGNLARNGGALIRLRDRFRATPDRLPADWRQQALRWKSRDYPLGLYVSRGILLSLEVGDWATLSDALLALIDAPDAVEAAMESLGEMTVSLLEPVVRQVQPDFAVFSEPIASFHAPVISPAHYRRFYGPLLRRIVAMLETHGVQIRIVQTYGNAAPLLPVWLDMGLNTFWFYHAHPAGIDYLALRRRYGPGLRLIGGIDARALLKDPSAIDEAVQAIVPALLAQGRYLPLLEDRVRSFVPYPNYRYYRQRLLEVVGEL